MPHRCAASGRHPCSDERQADGDRYLDHDGCDQRTADREQQSSKRGDHECFFLSLRTRSISLFSASSSPSAHDSSITRDFTIWPIEPPKKVSRNCLRAVFLAATGEMVAE